MFFLSLSTVSPLEELNSQEHSKNNGSIHFPLGLILTDGKHCDGANQLLISFGGLKS